MFSTLKENDIHIEYSGTFLPAAEADGYFAHLKELEFYPLTLKFSERTVTPLRRICAFSDGGQMDYTFSGATVKSSPWTPALLEIKQRVETTFNQSYNLCLVNIYPNGSAYISPHRDDEKFHVEGSSIATISFGDTRTITFTRSGFEPINYDLQHGSALIMYSPTNSYWKHGIKKTSNSDVRISLTFHTMKVMSNTPQPCVSKDDDSLIEAEYANLFKTSYYNAQSDLLDYERSKIHHLVQRRKEAKRKPVDSFGDENDDFNKKLRAINELDLDFDIVKLKLSDTLYLSCTQFNGELKVHLREHYQDSNGLYKPTKYGFTWALDTWYDIYIKFNDFTLKYSNTSFIANNTVAFMSFSESLVIKSLYRAEQTLTLNAAQLKKFNNCIANFTKTIVEYIMGGYLRKTLEKYVPVREHVSHTDIQLIQILISCIEDNLNVNCLKRFICEGCLSDSLSEHKHSCQTFSKREIFQTFSDAIYLTLNCKEILKQFKSQVESMSKTFLCLISYEYMEPKVFDIL